MQHILVLQWRGSAPVDFAELIRMEQELEGELGASSSVDGHDVGSGEVNIFIETDEPARAFAEVQRILGHWPRWPDVRVAHREKSGDTYAVLWPPGQTEFRVK